MNFEFPDEHQYIEVAEVSSVEELGQILKAYRQFYRDQGFMFYYEIRSWTLMKNSKIHKIGAYCKFCDKAKLIYSKNQGQSTFELQEYWSYHTNHPKIQKNTNKICSKTQSQFKSVEKKQTKNADLKSEQFMDILYKQYIIEWLTGYEKSLKKVFEENQNIEGARKIDSHLLRKSIKIQSEVIDEHSENDLFFRDDLWNEMVSQILRKEEFTREFFLRNFSEEQDHDDSFSNCLLVSNSFSISSKQQHLPTYIIRRQIKVDIQPNLVNHSQGRQSNCLVAFSYAPNRQIKLLWFAFAEKRPQCLVNKPQQMKEHLNILEALLEVESIRTFSSELTFIEDDEILMTAFTLLKQVIQRQSPLFRHNVCIHPLILDDLIMVEKASGQLKDTLKQVIRCRQQSQANDKLIKAMKLHEKDKCFIQKFMKLKEFAWVSCLRHNRFTSVEFLPDEFYKRNNIKNVFQEVGHWFGIKNSITLNELSVVLINIFMHISESQSLTESHKVSKLVQDQWHFLILMIQKTPEQIKPNWLKITQNPKYQLSRIISSCPRIIIQLFYMNTEKSLQVYIQKCTLKEVEQARTIKAKDKLQRYFNVKFDVQSFRNLEEQNKLWYCDCDNQNLCGVPCEHQILCALNFETSIFREFDPKWRFQQQFQVCSKSKMITSFLKKMIL